MTPTPTMTDDKLRECAKLSGCEMLKCMEKAHRCWKREEWDVSKPSRGLGDVVAKITHWTGIDRAVKAVATATGTDCGCGKRQKQLNEAMPFN